MRAGGLAGHWWAAAGLRFLPSPAPEPPARVSPFPGVPQLLAPRQCQGWGLRLGWDRMGLGEGQPQQPGGCGVNCPAWAHCRAAPAPP